MSSVCPICEKSKSLSVELCPNCESTRKRASASLNAFKPVDNINPDHYKSHPSGIECIVITRHMNFNIGNVFKYLWRAGLKSKGATIEDHEKAMWYLRDEIDRLKKLEAAKALNSVEDRQ